MAKRKSFLTYSQQVDSLINDKGLLVSDRPGAIEALKEVSYFALISGYKIPFRDPDTNRYREGVHFRDIRALYDFDVRLSSTILRYLLSVERHLQSLYGYHFVRLYGDRESVYLNPQSYDLSTRERREEVDQLVSILKGIARNEVAEQKYIDHYRKNYSDVPLWILMHAVTFGQLERLYFCAKQELRDVICTEFPSLKSRNIVHILPLLVRLRNVCAHSAPLYNVHLRTFIPPFGVHHELGLIDEDGHCCCGSQDLFAGLICLRYLMNGDEFGRLSAEIDSELDTLFQRSNWLSADKLLPLMGFPENWRDLSRIEL